MRFVAVGTQNPIKTSAVKRIVEKIFKDEFTVIQVKVESSVPKQPIGLRQTIKGAVSRARQAITASSNAEFGIGIEAGLTKVPKTITGYFDIQFAAVMDREGKVTIGCGSGFEYPPLVVNEVLRKGKEVGDIMESLTGINNIGERIGAIGYLSHGELDRCSLTEQAVLMAFIPRINERLYFKLRDKEDLA
jgi:inosine/xanthosine triphosphatase